MFVVKEELLRALTRYLATKPWHEVNGFMVEFEKLQPLPPPHPPKEQ